MYGDSHYSNELVSSRIVLKLSYNLLNKGYCIFIDNYYINIDLSDKLIKYRTNCIETMRKNKVNIKLQIENFKRVNILKCTDVNK